MPEAWQQRRLVEELDADHHAALGQDQILDGVEPVERQLPLRL